MLATEVAQRRPTYPADYDEIAKVQEKQNPVVLSQQACRERMNGLICILNYLEEDKKPIKRWAFGNI